MVANSLEDVDTMQLIQETGGLRKLLAFTEVSTLTDFQKNAAKAIAKAAYDRMSLLKVILFLMKRPWFQSQIHFHG